MKVERVMERVYDRRRLHDAWQKVEHNAGAAGIDRMTVQEFANRERELLERIHEKLKAGTYRFKPARRVLIPKPGSKAPRKLNIPGVMDRIVSQSLHTVLEEIFDGEFTASNFGYRRGRQQQEAVKHAREAVLEGYEWCASIDIQGCFDAISHGLIFRLIRRRIRDERVVTLVARVLKAGVVVDGKVEKTTQGCPQGSPVSPMLSNIVLNELDHELERRGHRYARWADDVVILLKSERAARRVMDGVTQYLEEELNLPENREKIQVTLMKHVTFLGFQILRGKIRISDPARKRFKQEVRARTPRNNGRSMYAVIQEVNRYLQGWIGYFRIQEFRTLLRQLDGFTRSRLRAMQLKKWKKPKKFQRMMVRLGSPVEHAKQTWVRMNKWQSVQRAVVKLALNLKWFRRQGVLFLDDYTQRNLELQFTR